MEAKEFGVFIATLRKELNMTQAELAEKINVTDKAVSRWERGLGFPDINTLEPLAEALNISIVELMKSCKKEASDGTDVITKEDVSEIIQSTADMSNYYKKRQTAVLVGIFLFTVMFSSLFVHEISPGILFLLGLCAVVGIVSTCLLMREWEDEKSRYLYLRLIWISFGTVFIGVIQILPSSFIAEHIRILDTSVNWFMVVADFIIIYQAILNAKKGNIKWRWAIITIICISALLFWDLYIG